MQYDFWNNPLVVSAMRLKYRRSSPGITTCLYLLVLLTIGATLHHYQEAYNMPPGRAFLLAILGLQFLVSGGIALFTVANSMNAEVTNRTLDFQRIVSLRPYEILLGKMLGEPAISYFLALATLPFAVICWLEGSVTVVTMIWFYINLATFTLLCAAIGTIHTLVLSTNTTGMRRNNNGSVGLAFIWVPMMIFPTLLTRGTGWLQDSWLGAIINLCTPIGSLRFLFKGQPWDAQITLWGYTFPSLVVAPLMQLVLAYWIVMAMSRRLKNPIDPPVRRLHTYAALIIFDLLLAGVCFTQWQHGMATGRLLAQFGLSHLIASLVFLIGITPVKQVLVSWLWRFQTREPWLRSSCLGSRSEITLVLPIYCLLGVVIVFVGFALPTNYTRTPVNAAVRYDSLLEVMAVTSTLILALGMLHQGCVAIAGRSGLLIYAACLLLINILPPIVVSLLLYPQSLRTAQGLLSIVVSLSPGAYYLSHLTRFTLQPLPCEWLIATQIGLLLGCFWMLRRWLNNQQAVVATKLASMEVQ